MLRVTVELWPGGRESGSRVLATAKIGRIKNGALADYKVELHEDVQGEIGAATLDDYPRYDHMGPGSTCCCDGADWEGGTTSTPTTA
jgi:hypothetical protein